VLFALLSFIFPVVGIGDTENVEDVLKVGIDNV
jgi:hypothetical protein